MKRADFLKLIKTSEGCSEWTGARGGKGKHGQVVFEGKTWYVHRLAYYLTIGEIPDGLEVLHKCDNPVCFKPEHLYLGNQQDNARDAVYRNRGFGTSKLHTKDVVDILYSHFNNHESGSSLARRYKVSPTAISQILRGRHYPLIYKEVMNGKSTGELARHLPEVYSSI